MNSIIDSLTQELKRGTIVLCVLSRLHEEKYGYALIQDLSKFGFDIDQSTLYPLLRRLEKQGLLSSDWNLEEKRPRKYYKVTKKGKEVFDKLSKEYELIQGSVKKILEGSK